MPSVIGTSGGNKTVTAMAVGTSGGNKAVLNGYVGTAGGNKLFFSALSATAAPTPINASGPAALITTGTTTATPVGGSGSYSYAWSIDNPAITITAPTSATTAFQATLVTVGDTETGTASCVVTDTATGATALTNNVTVTIARV